MPRIGLLFQVFRTNEMTAKLVSRALAPTGLRGDDYAVYSYLLHGPMTLTDLAEGTGMPLTTAAGYVKRFEQRGDIIREPNPDDGRSQLLSLTPACRDWIGEVAAIFTKTVNYLDSVMEAEGVNAEELIDQLQQVQDLIARSLEELDAPD